MNEQHLSEVFKRIEASESGMIQMQADLTAIPALSPENNGEGEIKRVEYLKPFLENLHPDLLMEIKAPDERVPAGYRPNLIVKFNGKNQEKTVWIMAHTDIVPPGDLSRWSSDPYKMVVKDGKLFGRGVEDNQQGLVGAIFAIKAFRDLNLVPDFNVGLAIVADEETGSQKGLGYVLNHHRELFNPQDLIVIPDAGNSEGTEIEVAEKSIYWLRFEVTGKQCHGSTPEIGINAHKAGAKLIVELDSLYKTFNAVDNVFKPPISTFEPTKKEANVPNINTIPGSDIFYFDCRILPVYQLTEVDAEIQRIVQEIEKNYGVNVTISSPQREQAAPATPVDAPIVNALKKAIKKVYQRDAHTLGIGGGTVAAFFRRAGFPAAVWSTLDDSAHQPDEFCHISNMMNDTKVFAHLFFEE